MRWTCEQRSSSITGRPMRRMVPIPGGKERPHGGARHNPDPGRWLGWTGRRTSPARAAAGRAPGHRHRGQGQLLALRLLHVAADWRTRALGRRPSKSRKARSPGIEWVHGEVVSIDAARRAVRTQAGTLEADQLAIALGGELAPEAVPGLPETALNLYDPDAMVRLSEQLDGAAERWRQVDRRVRAGVVRRRPVAGAVRDRHGRGSSVDAEAVENILDVGSDGVRGERQDRRCSTCRGRTRRMGAVRRG